MLRRGIAFFYVGEYKKALENLNRANELPEENNDKEKVQQYILKAEKGLQEQTKALLKRKKALQTAFNSSSSSSLSSSTSSSSSQNSIKSKWNQKNIILLVICIGVGLVSILLAYLKSHQE